MIQSLPVTKTAQVIEPKGIGVTLRGRGKRVATGTLAWSEGRTRLTPIAPERDTNETQQAAAEAARSLLVRAIEELKRYAREPAVGQVMRLAADEQTPVEYLQGHEFLINVEIADDGTARLCVDTDVPHASGKRAQELAALYALGLHHEACHLRGCDEAAALKETLTFYEALTADDQRAVREALSLPTVDNEGVFARFLQEGAGKPEAEKERLVAWVRARTRIELPYNGAAVRKVVETEKEDLEGLRTGIFNAINESYVPEVDTTSCARIADWCRERGQRLVGGRFSRAFYIDAMLMASSGLLAGSDLKGPVQALERFARATSLELRTPGVRPISFAEALGGEMQQVVNLVAQDTVSTAEVEGALEQFKKSLRTFEFEVLRGLDEQQRKRGSTIASQRRAHQGQSQTWDQLADDRSAISGKVNELMKAVSMVEGAAEELPKRDPAFMVFFQRLFPLDAINMGLVNELVDPFFGEDDQVHRLIRECGHNMYVTPNLQAWLRKCDDWIEALPAYATYQIVPKSNGGYQVRAWVQRSIMEDMYRRHAEDWALNIEEVMASEHVALARRFLAERRVTESDLADQMEARGLSREEAIRDIAREQDWADDIAGLAALIEASHDGLCVQVAERRREDGLSRIEALACVIREVADPQNLASQVLQGSPVAETLETHKLTDRAASLRPEALKRRRELPCVHVLTTLGPGETEMNVRNWLEESMALFNLCRRHNLEGEVAQRIDAYQKRLIAAGQKIVQELDLQGDLYSLMQEEGLSPDSRADRDAAILRLLASYPEVSLEVAKLCLLADSQPSRNPEDVSDPDAVARYEKDHPGLATEAAAKVAADNGLQGEISRHRKEHGAKRHQAVAAVVEANPHYAAERDVLATSLARLKVLESLGLAEDLKDYVRSRMDKMAATVRARREAVARHGLSDQLNDPRFRYDATGPFKKYHLLYTPSRVDLGAEEVHSVRNVPKWVGGLDREAARAGKALYRLYNVAGPTAVRYPRLAEFLKVGENFFSRGGVFYLSLAAGANLDALGVGDFEFFRDQWNARGDRTVLPTGETYGGFCVPKEFSLLYAIIIAAVSRTTSAAIMDAFLIPKEIRPQVTKDLRRVLRMQLDAADGLDWEAKAAQFLSEQYPQYFATLGGQGYVARLPQLAQALKMAGMLAAQDQREVGLGYELAYWINKKALGLEEINRVGPFRKVHLICQLAKEARRKNARVAGDPKLIGVMGAPYKEGERKEGKEILITDVRFSAGARKLEIYAGTAEHHLLKDLDPEGRTIIRKMLEGFQSPADIRMVGTCTGSDVLNHVPASGLEALKDDVMRLLMEAGLDENTIDTNCTVYGGDLEQWSGIKGLPDPQRKALIERIGPGIHLLVLDRRGTYRTYEQAIQGVDYVDLGIPDPELLDLVDNLPKMISLMRRGRPNSALVFADGTSGARRRTFSFRYASGELKVKELFALDDCAVYGANGLGRQTVEDWRQEMATEKATAQALLEALLAGDQPKLTQVYEGIAGRVALEEKAERAAKDQIAARELGVDPSPYVLMASAFGRVRQGLPVEQMDFGVWLVLGGMYTANGKMSPEELSRLRLDFDQAVSRLAPDAQALPRDTQFVDSVIETFFHPRYEPPAEGEYREVDTGISGSLKAAEEKVSRLQKREARLRMARRASNLRTRQRSFVSQQDAVLTATDFETAYKEAIARLGEGRSHVPHEGYGEFLAWAGQAVQAMIGELFDEGHRAAAADRAEAMFNGGEVELGTYEALERTLSKAAERTAGNAETLEKIAQALELLDVSLLIEKTQDADDPDEMMIELARFFDVTLNNHIFDCIPYHYHKERGAGFEGCDRQQKFELASRRHRWLYTHARWLMTQHTPLKRLRRPYQDAWLGDADKDMLGLGVKADDPAQRFWFGYARLRDAAVLAHEGFVFPEIFEHLDPDVLQCTQRTNVVIVYPHGNTTVPVALEQGAKLAQQEGINLMLTAWPEIVDDPRYGRKVLHVHDGLMYVSRQDYAAALKASGVNAGTAAAQAGKVGKEGVLVAVGFSRPIVAEGIFFHFTHPLRPRINQVAAPLIQPFLWEAATHLKCRLPDMLKGSGVRTADQINWYHQQAAKLSEKEAKSRIVHELTEFSQKHDTLIVKPEKESGGRQALILPVRHNGQPIVENIAGLADLVYDICKTDNAVIQDVLKCRVRQLYTRAFQEDMVDRFANIGVPVLLDRDPPTPLFSYFRQILVLGDKDYEISHHITVVSTRGIANVGQGGLLYEYTDDIINPKYRGDLRREITRAAFDSVQAERAYIAAHCQEILQEYLAAHPEYGHELKAQMGEDLTGLADADIPYEMGDYMPVFLVDGRDNLVRLYDPDTEAFLPLFDAQGRPTDVEVCDEARKPIPRFDQAGKPLPIPMFDEGGVRIARFDAKGRPISTLVILKIEPNPGAGLWRPHNDQLPESRKGEGVYTIFRCLGQRARQYREELAELAGQTAPREPIRAAKQARYLSGQTPQTAEEKQPTSSIDAAIRKAEQER